MSKRKLLALGFIALHLAVIFPRIPGLRVKAFLQEIPAFSEYKRLLGIPDQWDMFARDAFYNFHYTVRVRAPDGQERPLEIFHDPSSVPPVLFERELVLKWLENLRPGKKIDLYVEDMARFAWRRAVERDPALKGSDQVEVRLHFTLIAPLEPGVEAVSTKEHQIVFQYSPQGRAGW